MSALFRIAIANLVTRKARTALTLIGVAVAVASFIALFTLARGPESNWRNSLRESKVHVVGYERGVVHIISSRLPIGMLADIRKVPGVRAVTPQINRFVPAEDEQQQVVLVGVPAGNAFWREIPLKTGRLPRAGEVWVAVLGPSIAEGLNKKVGDTITLLWRKFTVIGISAQTNPLNATGVLAPLEALQELAHSKDSVTSYALQLDRPEDEAATERTLAALNALRPNAQFVRTADITRSSQVLKLLQAITWAVSAIALVMGVLVVANTLVMSITERTREIGVMSAIGWSAGRITGLILMEGALVTAIGGVAGVAGGIGLAYLMASLPVLSGLVEPVFSVELVVMVMAVIAVIGTLGGLYPAWLATRVDPARVLQYE
ncbi:MAG: ABC transporter permease [Bauldia litoralis]